MIIDRICEVCREVFGQTDTAKWGNNEPPFETICPSCTATPGPEGPQIPSATFQPREGITCPGLLLDFFWASDAEALAWIRRHVSTEGWPDEACTDEPPKTDTPTPPALLTPEQFRLNLECVEIGGLKDDRVATNIARLKAHDAALREQVRQANEKRDSFVQEVDGKADRIQRLWDEIAFDITNLRTQLATAEGERAALLHTAKVLHSICTTPATGEIDRNMSDTPLEKPAMRWVEARATVQSRNERLALKSATDPRLATGLALLAEGEAAGGEQRE